MIGQVRPTPKCALAASVNVCIHSVGAGGESAIGRPSLRPDHNLFLPLAWHMGFHAVPIPGVLAGFGHAGMGGSIGWADPASGIALGFVHNRLLTPMIFDQATFIGLGALLRRGAAAARKHGYHIVPDFGAPYPKTPRLVAGQTLTRPAISKCDRNHPRSSAVAVRSLPPQGDSEGPTILHLLHSTASRSSTYIEPFRKQSIGKRCGPPPWFASRFGAVWMVSHVTKVHARRPRFGFPGMRQTRRRCGGQGDRR